MKSKGGKTQDKTPMGQPKGKVPNIKGRKGPPTVTPSKGKGQSANTKG